jgi:hypothetical protein
MTSTIRFLGGSIVVSLRDNCGLVVTDSPALRAQRRRWLAHALWIRVHAFVTRPR